MYRGWHPLLPLFRPTMLLERERKDAKRGEATLKQHRREREEIGK
jgi:hypothetical protein